MKIYLLRHGETAYNQKRCFYGVTDVPLNQTGIAQSQQMQEKLHFFPADYAVYASEKLRTRQTAEIVFPRRSVTSLACFNEKSFGRWEGLTADEIGKKYPKEWQDWLDRPFDYTPPEADNFHSFKEKVINGFCELLMKQQSFAIVSHLGVSRVILSFCFPEQDFWDFQLDQGCYSCLDYSEKGFKILSWNK